MTSGNDQYIYFLFYPCQGNVLAENNALLCPHQTGTICSPCSSSCQEVLKSNLLFLCVWSKLAERRRHRRLSKKKKKAEGEASAWQKGFSICANGVWNPTWRCNQNTAIAEEPCRVELIRGKYEMTWNLCIRRSYMFLFFLYKCNHRSDGAVYGLKKKKKLAANMRFNPEMKW